MSLGEVNANTFNIHDGQTGNVKVRQQPKGEFHSLVIIIKLN